jgi:hypothetical protein
MTAPNDWNLMSIHNQGQADQLAWLFLYDQKVYQRQRRKQHGNAPFFIAGLFLDKDYLLVLSGY